MTQNYSKIYDLSLATVLLTLGYKLLKLEKDTPKKVIFVFESEEGIEQDITDYWNNKIKLPAQELLNNQKMLKVRIFSNM